MTRCCAVARGGRGRAAGRLPGRRTPGSRTQAAAADRRRAGARRRRAAAQAPRARRRRARSPSTRRPRRGAPTSRPRAVRGSPTRTSTCSSSTSPPASSSIPATGHRPGTLVQALAGRVAGGPDPERPGVVHRLDRDTSGLLVLARSRGGPRGAAGRAARARDHPRVPRARRGPPAGARAGRSTRRSAATAACRTRISTDTDDPRHAVTHFETERALPDDDAAAGARSRPAARTRSARTCWRSAIRWPATPSTGTRAAHGLAAPVPARRAARVRAPGHRGSRGAAGAAAGGPGQGPPAGVRGTGRPSV